VEGAEHSTLQALFVREYEAAHAEQVFVAKLQVLQLLGHYQTPQ